MVNYIHKNFWNIFLANIESIESFWWVQRYVEHSKVNDVCEKKTMKKNAINCLFKRQKEDTKNWKLKKRIITQVFIHSHMIVLPFFETLITIRFLIK